MDWDDLKYFLSVSHSQTLSEAANKLAVNQTTVSRRIKRLQDKLGVRIYHHNANGMDITNAGEEVSAAAQQIESIVASLQRKLLGLDERLSGPLRITTVEYIASFENQLFKSFMQRYPGVELEISANEETEDLVRGDADVALRWTNDPAQHLVGRKLCRAEFALYQRAEQQSWQDTTEINQLPWIAWDQACEAKLTDAWMKQHVPEASVHCRTNSALAMYHAVKSGLGVAFLPCAYADPDPELVRLRDIEFDFGMDIWTLTHPDLRGTAKVRAFTDHAQRYFARQQQRYAGKIITKSMDSAATEMLD